MHNWQQNAKVFIIDIKKSNKKEIRITYDKQFETIYWRITREIKLFNIYLIKYNKKLTIKVYTETKIVCGIKDPKFI